MTQCGTPGYVAPEILNGIPYGTQADMWSLGVILYIILVGYPPFNGKNQKELFRLIRKGKFEFHEQFWNDISDDAKEVVSMLLTIDPKKRFTANDLLESKWANNSTNAYDRDITKNLVQFRKFNAKRKLKHAVFTVSRLTSYSSIISVARNTKYK